MVAVGNIAIDNVVLQSLGGLDIVCFFWHVQRWPVAKLVVGDTV